MERVTSLNYLKFTRQHRIDLLGHTQICFLLLISTIPAAYASHIYSSVIAWKYMQLPQEPIVLSQVSIAITVLTAHS